MPLILVAAGGGGYHNTVFIVSVVLCKYSGNGPARKLKYETLRKGKWGH